MTEEIRRPMPIDVVQEHDGIAEVVIDHPPVNALDVAGWFALADAVVAAGRVPDQPGRGPARDRARLLCRCRHQGDQRQGGRGAGRREPRLRRRLRRRLRLRGARHRRGAGLLPRGRHRPGRQRGHRRRRPRTPPSGCPRSIGARSAPPPTSHGSSPNTPCARWSTRPSPSRRPSWPPSARSPRSCRRIGCGRRRSSWPPTSPPRVRPSSAGPRSRSTGSIPSM